MRGAWRTSHESLNVFDWQEAHQGPNKLTNISPVVTFEVLNLLVMVAEGGSGMRADTLRSSRWKAHVNSEHYGTASSQRTGGGGGSARWKLRFVTELDCGHRVKWTMSKASKYQPKCSSSQALELSQHTQLVHFSLRRRDRVNARQSEPASNREAGTGPRRRQPASAPKCRQGARGGRKEQVI